MKMDLSNSSIPKVYASSAVSILVQNPTRPVLSLVFLPAVGSQPRHSVYFDQSDKSFSFASILGLFSYLFYGSVLWCCQGKTEQ